MTSDPLAVLWWAALALTAASIAYLLLATAAVAAWRVRVGLGWSEPPKVTVLKPMCGREDGLEEAVESFLSQETSSSVRFVFGFADEADPALALCRRLAARHPGREVDIVVDPAMHGPNPKVSNLVNMAKSGLDEVVVITDSDAMIAPGVLQRAIDSLAAPGVGAVTALYRARPGVAGEPIRAFGAWFLDYWFLPTAVLHARLAPLSVTYGPLTAIRGDVLAQVGGLEALAPHLSDDARLGELVRGAGYEITFTPDVVETLVNDASLAELFDHELRWSRTVRSLEPIGFFASVVTHPGPLPLLLLLRSGWLAIALILLPVLLRWILASVVDKRFGRAEGLMRSDLLGIWLRDFFCFAVWAKACFVRRVGWRGQRLAIERRDILRHPVEAGQEQA